MREPVYGHYERTGRAVPAIFGCECAAPAIRSKDVSLKQCPNQACVELRNVRMRMEIWVCEECAERLAPDE